MVTEKKLNKYLRTQMSNTFMSASILVTTV